MKERKFIERYVDLVSICNKSLQTYLKYAEEPVLFSKPVKVQLSSTTYGLIEDLCAGFDSKNFYFSKAEVTYVRRFGNAMNKFDSGIMTWDEITLEGKIALCEKLKLLFVDECVGIPFPTLYRQLENEVKEKICETTIKLDKIPISISVEGKGYYYDEPFDVTTIKRNGILSGFYEGMSKEVEISVNDTTLPDMCLLADSINKKIEEMSKEI